MATFTAVTSNPGPSVVATVPADIALTTIPPDEDDDDVVAKVLHDDVLTVLPGLPLESVTRWGSIRTIDETIAPVAAIGTREGLSSRRRSETEHEHDAS